MLVALQLACYAAGIGGWVGALGLLWRRWCRARGGTQGSGKGGGRTQLVLLGALAANDLVALCGMLALLCASRALPAPPEPRALCVARVLLRVFGMGSACIGMAMALDRYLALTRPFFYQKRVSGRTVAWAVGAWWAVGGALTLLPLAGAGRYYEADTAGAAGGCRRYRDPVAPHHLLYALSYITFGSSVCVVLVWCNVRVIRALCSISQLPVRRCSGRVPPRPPRPGLPLSVPAPMATPHELAFTRLMATLSVLAIVCWLPQMVTAALYVWRAVKSGAAWGGAAGADGAVGAEAGWLRALSVASDLLLLANYTLDPYLYVLARRRRLRLPRLCRPPSPASPPALELAPLKPAAPALPTHTHTSLSFIDS